MCHRVEPPVELATQGRSVERQVHLVAQQRHPVERRFAVRPSHALAWQGGGGRGAPLGPAGDEIVEERVQTGRRDIGMGKQVGGGVETAIGVAPFAPAAQAIVAQQAAGAARHVRVFGGVEVRVEQRADHRLDMLRAAPGDGVVRAGGVTRQPVRNGLGRFGHACLS
jgi:hypothetical protein